MAIEKSAMIKAREATGAFHRMPLGYGPFPGPRQTWEGKSRLGTKAWTETRLFGCNVTFKTPKKFIESILPHESFSFDVPGDDVYCTWAVLDLQNLGWLGGRGYKTFGLYVHDVVVKGETETIRGDYLSVLYESIADPITSGREELGIGKIFADMKDKVWADEYEFEASWDGFTFAKIKVKGIVEKPLDNPERVQTSFKPPEGVLHYKYIPATGRPGFADVEYPVVTPFSNATGKSEMVKVAVASAKDTTVEWDAANWDTLPTMHHIVDVFSKIEVKEIVDVRLTWQRGSGDFSNQRAVQ
jgi:hypothetical protein